MVDLSKSFYSQVDFSCEGPYYPSEETSKVWAVPVSLAATKGISFDFFSSGYLDVSVRQVPFITLCIQIMMYRHYPIQISPFGNPRIKVC